MTSIERKNKPSREWVSVKTLIDRRRCSELQNLSEDPSFVDVPTRCIHDSVVIEALEHLGMRDAFVGRPPETGLAVELVDAIETHASSEPVRDERPVTLYLPRGKAAIVQAISRECAKQSRDTEARVMSSFFGLGIDSLNTA